MFLISSQIFKWKIVAITTLDSLSSEISLRDIVLFKEEALKARTTGTHRFWHFSTEVKFSSDLVIVFGPLNR